MDPTAAYRAMREAMHANDPDVILLHADALSQWLMKDGFPPSGLSRATAFSAVKSATRFANGLLRGRKPAGRPYMPLENHDKAS